MFGSSMLVELRAELLELRERGAHALPRRRRRARRRRTLGQADRAGRPSGSSTMLRVARHRLVERRRVARVEARHRLEQQRAVLGRLREHAGLVEARGERDHAVARHAP